MGNEKDITEKMLFDAEDVFADILNVLLLEGKERILPETLSPAGQRSQLKIGKTIHEQERDIAKLWMAGRIRFALFGLENQTEEEPDMVLRVFSYDGSSYKEQVIHNRKKGAEKWRPYPVITIVLYFGKTRWKGPKTLKELLGSGIPPELEAYVNDYQLHIFEISFLSREQVSMFKSDFRIVADYFVQMRENKEYEPSKETIIHVEETLKLMAVLTGDQRFEESANEAVTQEGGPVTMCEAFDRAENRGMQRGLEKGLKKGLERGKAEGRFNTLAELVLDGILPVSEAAARANLSEQEFLRKTEEYKRLDKSKLLGYTMDHSGCGAEQTVSPI